MTGETDLCLSMGYELEPNDPPHEVQHAIRRISKIAQTTCKWQGGRIRPSTGGVKDMMARGIQMIVIGLDAWMFRDGLSTAVEQAELST